MDADLHHVAQRSHENLIDTWQISSSDEPFFDRNFVCDYHRKKDTMFLHISFKWTYLMEADPKDAAEPPRGKEQLPDFS